MYFSRKMTQKLGIIQQTANATVVSSTGALSTAVDRMSFAHDIVMMSDDAIAIGLGLDVQVEENQNLSFFLNKLKILF